MRKLDEHVLINHFNDGPYFLFGDELTPSAWLALPVNRNRDMPLQSKRP